MEKSEKKTTWQILSAIDCSEHIERKKTGKKTVDGKDETLSYLSWAWAWGILRQNFSEASYSVREWNNRPYLHDPILGYMVETSVTIDGETISMRLPVMDGKNKAMKDHPYEYSTYNGKKSVEAASMFDINSAIMRCLTKNISMFGLGHYIYAGEDVPQETIENAGNEVFEIVKTIDSLKKLNEYFKSLPGYLKSNKKIIDAFSAQKVEIQQNNIN